MGGREENFSFTIYKKRQLRQGGREHAVGQRCAFHVAVCGGKQKVRVDQIAISPLSISYLSVAHIKADSTRFGQV